MRKANVTSTEESKFQDSNPELCDISAHEDTVLPAIKMALIHLLWHSSAFECPFSLIVISEKMKSNFYKTVSCN